MAQRDGQERPGGWKTAFLGSNLESSTSQLCDFQAGCLSPLNLNSSSMEERMRSLPTHGSFNSDFPRKDPVGGILDLLLTTGHDRASQLALVVKNLPANAGGIRDPGSIPGSRRFPGGGHGNPLQSSCLGNPTVRGGWWAMVHRAAT